MIRPEHLIVLSSTTISIYPTIGGTPVSQPFPKKFLAHQEVLAARELMTNLSEYLRRLGVTKTTLILLADDLVYQKSFTPVISENSDPRVEAFLTEVPFERDKILFRILTGQGRSMIIATNREIPDTIVSAIRRGGGSVVATVPLLAYGKEFHTPLLPAEQLELAGNSRIADFADMFATGKKPWYSAVTTMIRR